MEVSSDSDLELFDVNHVSEAEFDVFTYEDPLLFTGVLKSTAEANIVKLEELFKAGKSPNINDTFGNTPLHVAVLKNLPHIVERLLAHPELNINAQNFRGETALFLSVKRKNKSILTQLLKHDANPNLPNLEQMTPLHLTVIGNNPEIAHLLIKFNAILDVEDYKGDTPLIEAVRANNLEIVCMLLYYNADTSFGEFKAFKLSLIQRFFDLQSILIEYVSDFNHLKSDEICTNNNSALLLYDAIINDSPFVEEIIKRGADVNFPNSANFNLFTTCLTMKNFEMFKIIWPKVKYQSLISDRSYLSMIYKKLETDAELVFKFLRFILDSGNLAPIFVNLKNFTSYYINYGIEDRVAKFMDIIYELVFLYLCEGYSLNSLMLDGLLLHFGYTNYFYQCLHMDHEYFPPCEDYISILWVLCKPKLTIDTFKWQCYAQGYDEPCTPHFRFPRMDINDSDYGVGVSSLLELSRNKLRDYLVKKFNLNKCRLYYTFVHNLPVPSFVKDYLTFRKPIYKEIIVIVSSLFRS